MSRRALILATLLLAGCSSMGDTIEKYNPFSSDKPKLAPLAPITDGVATTLRWQASAGAMETYAFTPAVVGETVFAASHDGAITRFENGREMWRAAIGQSVSAALGADKSRVVVGTLKGEVISLDAATGKELWRTRLPSEILGAPALGDDFVAVRIGDSRIAALALADGKRRWLYQRATPALSVRNHAGVIVAGKVVLAGFPAGKLVAINASSGAAVWEGTVAIPKGATELERIADVTSLPVVTGSQACAVAYQGRLACFDLTNGAQLWTRDVSSRPGLATDGRNVYVSDDKGVVHAFDRSTGASVWRQEKLVDRGLGRPLVVGNRIVVADSLGVVHVLRKEDGATVSRYIGSDDPIDSDPVALSGGLLVQNRSGSLMSLTIQ